MHEPSLGRATAEDYARWFQALADPTRILIVRFVSRQERPVPAGVIVDHLKLSQSTVSHHLKILRQARFLTTARAGTSILYSLNDHCLTQLPEGLLTGNGPYPGRASPRTVAAHPDGHTPIKRPEMDATTPPTGDTPAPVLLLIGSGDRRYREYILAAITRDFRLWLLDAYEPTWQLPYIEGATVLNTKDVHALHEAAGHVAAALPVVGVFTYDESLVHAAAQLAQTLGLPGSPPRAVLACRDKAATRAILTEAEIPQPASIPVADADEATAAAETIGYPVVVKARGLAGSMGVLRADTPAAVREAYTVAAAATYAGVPRYEADVLIEELLTGEEISIDAVITDGVCTPMVLARKQVGCNPYFEEIGHTVHSADPLMEDPELLDQLNRIHKAIGYVHGATHTEFKLTPHGPRLIEINARLGGDFIPYLGALATGTDPAVAAAHVAAGFAPDTTPRTGNTAAIRFLYPAQDCIAATVTVRTDRLGPTIHRAVATAGPGTALALPPRAYLNRYGYVIAVGEDPEQVTADLADPSALIELRAQSPAS
ncbi:metalloregulator ArsR/SmtB family transcription factor [Streptomyces sp. NBC_01358]|uniref:metalloregulator ArsR/SmtB family transcription factor n=1 Tax=Streptomyces sp. NBC_01358 TaxID=2903837 RepID=UPI002E307267|nr:metalloregulator ArsR/SmtB family transcription factor [Streptomyces sp. NBC_01358]